MAEAARRPSRAAASHIPRRSRAPPAGRCSMPSAASMVSLVAARALEGRRSQGNPTMLSKMRKKHEQEEVRFIYLFILKNPVVWVNPAQPPSVSRCAPHSVPLLNPNVFPDRPSKIPIARSCSCRCEVGRMTLSLLPSLVWFVCFLSFFDFVLLKVGCGS